MTYAKGIRGGHASGDLTDPIIQALDNLQAGKIKSWHDAFASHQEARQAAGKLWHCKDLVGREIRTTVKDEFNLEKEPYTFAQISRILLNDLRAVEA